jgi:formyltetrahydrofolate-dependent phosphoribosylglycinamide formyltransferase
LTLRAAVFASGRGSNFEVLADHAGVDRTETAEAESWPDGPPAQAGTPAPPDWTVVLLVSDRSDAPALDRARERGIPAAVVPVKARHLDEVGEETLAVLREAEIDLCLLAGYLRLVPPQVVEVFRDRILNVHPALLPAFGGKGMYGLHVHRAVLEAGVRVTGPTVHFVDERYDRGPILAQWPVPVLEGDTPESLAARVTTVEHELYPAAVDELSRAIVEGREPRPLPRCSGDHPRFLFRADAPARGAADASPTDNEPADTGPNR